MLTGQALGLKPHEVRALGEAGYLGVKRRAVTRPVARTLCPLKRRGEVLMLAHNVVSFGHGARAPAHDFVA
jgi:hypothetical protein